MNYQKLFTLTIGIVLNSLWLTSANALTVSFSRQYDGGSFLEGFFSATDNNNDGVIFDETEVTSFQATFSDPSLGIEEIMADEGQSIEGFEYTIDTNELRFNVRTTTRNEPFPFTSNLNFDVNFQNTSDTFFSGDAGLVVEDFNNTGIAQVIPQVPEQTSTLAFLILGGLGVVSRLR